MHMPAGCSTQCQDMQQQVSRYGAARVAPTRACLATVQMQARDSTRNKWAAMAQLLPGRVDNSIKNHWHATLSRRLTEGTVNNR